MDIQIKKSEKVRPERTKQTLAPPEETANVVKANVIKANSSLKQRTIWDSIIKWSLYLLIFLTPLFFLPWGVSPTGANKQFLVTALVAVAFIAWLARTIAASHLVWVKSPLNLAMLVLVLVWGLTAYFSVNRQQSLGFLGPEPDGLLNFVKYVLAFFLVSVSLRKQKDWQKGILVFLTSSAILAIFVALKFVGLNFLPWDFAKANDFNTIGTINGLGLFLGFGLVLIIGLLLSGKEDLLLSEQGDEVAASKTKERPFDSPPRAGRSGNKNLFFKIHKFFRPGLIVLAIIVGAELLLINFRMVWWALGAAMLFLIAYGFAKEAQEIKEGKKNILGTQRLALPIVVLGICVLLLLVRLPLGNLIAFPAEVSPSASATWDITKNVWKSGGIKTYIFGSGPATFIYDYGLYHSVLINQTVFWGVRFNQGFSWFLTSLAAAGILGILSLLFLFLAFIWQGLRFMHSIGKNEPEHFVLILGADLFFLLSWFLYPLNFTIALFSFIGLGMLVASSSKNLRKISLLVSPQRTMLISLFLIILILAAVSGLYLEGQKYIASLYFSSGVNTFNKTQNPDTALPKFVQAINLDLSQDQYLRFTSQAFLIKASNILNSPTPSNGQAVEDLRSQFQVNISQAIAFAQRASQANSSESLNWSNLGFVYENILNFVTGGENFLIDSYQRAIKLEPANPALCVDLGRAHLTIIDKLSTQINQMSAAGQKLDQSQKAQVDSMLVQRKDEIEDGLAILEKCIELKPDHSPAHFLMVQLYDRQGNLAKAMAKSEDYSNLNPKDAGAAFQLGFLAYKNEQLAKAKTALLKAVALSENYSNARYFLGLIYDKEENKTNALEQFEKIAVLNPDNEEVKKILTNLKNNQPALEEIVPPAPAPEERKETPVEEKGGAKGERLK